MLLVGLTGGLGAGKSTAAAMLAARGAIVIDADELARRAVEQGTPGLAKVVEAFGPEVLAPDGSLDRQTLARLVFDDEDRRKALEAIVHPEVFRLFSEEVERRRDSDDVVVFDVPLLMETGLDEGCDLVVVVHASPDRQVARARTRGLDEEESRARIAAQLDPEERRARADVVLDNDGDLADLERQVDVLWERLEREAVRG
jgi:dephospho-CoA kinase